jgi:magnesium-transporting ATPase (P-type)
MKLTLLATDKTGTLTRNQMTVSGILSYSISGPWIKGQLGHKLVEWAEHVLCVSIEQR